MQKIAWDYRVGKSTVHFIIKETCTAIWDVLLPIVMPEPTEEEWNNVADSFFKRWNMPNCIGAIDGKHVTIQSPKLSGSEYFNYKKSFSIVLMALCDSYYRFLFIDVGACGSNHDATIFKESAFGKALLNNALRLPPAKNLPNTDLVMDHFAVADQAFPLSNRIMRPFPGRNLGDKKNIFNYRLSRARRTIENTFGILVQRWRILRHPIIANVDTCETIVKATLVLHNFLQKSEEEIPTEERRYCPTGFVDTVDEEGNLRLGTWRDVGMGDGLLPVAPRASNNSSRKFQDMRNNLADYFFSDEGSVSWQMKHVSIGLRQ